MTDQATTEKASDYSARAGQNISRGLKRGNDGKFTSASGSVADSKRTPTGTPAAKKPAKPAKGGSRRSRATARRAAPKPKKPAGQTERQRQAAERQRERMIQRQQAADHRVRQRDIRRGEQAKRQQQREEDAKKRKLATAQRRAAAEAARRQRAQQKPGTGGGKGGTKPAKPAKAPEFSAQLATTARKLQDGETLSEQETQTLIRNGLARRTKDGLVLSETGLRAARQQSTTKSVLTTFKDAVGNDRWLSVTTTSLEDRDREVISLAAIERDVARSYKAVEAGAPDHGPLRFWHVPGLDIGRCDFRCVVGKSLVESGTFDQAGYAGLIRPGDQMSPGFMHPWDQPDAERVYHDIHIFERSVTPARRASNPWTRIQVKEYQMLTQEKEREWRERGGDPDILSTLLEQQAQTEKAATDAGVRFKEDGVLVDGGAIRATIASLEAAGKTDLASALKQWLGDEPATTEKAAPEPAVEEAVEELAGEEEMGDDGPLLTESEMDLIADRVVLKLSPALDMEGKMRGYLDEMKGFFGQQVAKKDSEIADLKATITGSQTEIATLKEAVSILQDGMPNGVRAYRASMDPGTVTTTKAAEPAADPIATFFADAPGNRPSVQAIE